MRNLETIKSKIYSLLDLKITSDKWKGKWRESSVYQWLF